MQYQYIEVDPYKKPEALMGVNPRGLVPALKHGEYVPLDLLNDTGVPAAHTPSPI